MGDRANIIVKANEESEEQICLYTHNAGSALPQTLANALYRGEDRWGDEPYLTRIIFSEMIQDDVLRTTGYGISTYMCDSEDNDIHLYTETQTVSYDDEEYSFIGFIQKFKE